MPPCCAGSKASRRTWLAHCDSQWRCALINMQQRVMDRTDVVPVEALRDATTGLCQDIGQVVSVALGIGPDCDSHRANVPPSTSAENAAGLVTPALPSWLERPSVAQRRESLPSASSGWLREPVLPATKIVARATACGGSAGWRLTTPKTRSSGQIPVGSRGHTVPGTRPLG